MRLTAKTLGSKGGKAATATGFGGMLDEEEEAKLKAKRIGPFAFDIDDEIDAEVLTNE